MVYVVCISMSESVNSELFCHFSIRKPGHTLKIDDKECLNFATFNFLGFVGNDKIEVNTRFPSF